MPICPKCREKVNQDDVFCFECGDKLPEPQKTELAPEPQNTELARDTEEEQTNGWNISLFTLTKIGFFTAFISAIVIWVVGSNLYEDLQEQNIQLENRQIAIENINENLANELKESEAEYAKILDFYGLLQKENAELAITKDRANGDYTQLNTDYTQLNEKHNTLAENYFNLQKEYADLNEISDQTLRGFSSYKEFLALQSLINTQDELNPLSGAEGLYAEALSLQRKALEEGIRIVVSVGQLPSDPILVYHVHMRAQFNGQWYWWIPGQTEIIPTWFPDWYR